MTTHTKHKSRYRTWTEFCPDLVEEITKGVKAVLYRYAGSALQYSEDITQDLMVSIQRRFFVKGKTLHEGTLRTIIRQETLREQKRYHPPMTPANRIIIRKSLRYMLANDTKVHPNGYTAQSLTPDQWDTVRLLDRHAWSSADAAEEVGLPLTTVRQRVLDIEYRLSTYNSDKTPIYPAELEVALSQETYVAPTATDNAAFSLDELVRLAEDSLEKEDHEAILAYIEGKESIAALRGTINKLRRQVGVSVW